MRDFKFMKKKNTQFIKTTNISLHFRSFANVSIFEGIDKGHLFLSITQWSHWQTLEKRNICGFNKLCVCFFSYNIYIIFFLFVFFFFFFPFFCFSFDFYYFLFFFFLFSFFILFLLFFFSFSFFLFCWENLDAWANFF